MSVHKEFILKPISTILREGVSACRGISGGIENIAICDYVMQTLFLRMTGFQEQKLKCICWELATNDYEYRYERFSRKTLGECSCYDEKNTVMNDLIDFISKIDSTFDAVHYIDKHLLINEVHDEIDSIFQQSVLRTWAEHQYLDYEKIISHVQPYCYLTKGAKNYALFAKCDNCTHFNKTTKTCNSGCVKNFAYAFDMLYKHRNRCAHNTLSYQQNLPTLSALSAPELIYENYFFRFFLLMLIDNIFVKLYQSYTEVEEP